MSNYTMEDLQALEAQSEWKELLAYAKDIRPSQRNDEWKELVRKAAQALLAQQKTAEDKNYTANYLKSNFPFLEAEGVIGAIADDALFESIKSDIETSDEWSRKQYLEGYKRTAISSSISAETALRIAKYLKGKISDNELASYFEIALKAGGNYSADPDLHEAVLNGLTCAPYNDVAASARNLAFNFCKAEMAEAVEQRKLLEKEKASQRYRHFMQNYCMHHDTEECRIADF